jgi:glycosyltransferase involved in cell wall biosynthesis
MAKRKVLYVCHNHPVVRPGGGETYAFELYEAMRDSPDFEPVFLARTGPPASKTSRYHEGTLLAAVNSDPNQYFFFTDTTEYDWFFGTLKGKATIARYFRDFLGALRPEVVHFQHTLFFGYDAVRIARNTLPGVPIVYTLHEYLPICHRNGQMVRTGSEQPCTHASARRCHECFPDIPPQTFYMRKRFIESHLSLVDAFLAPSRFLLERYVDWGIPREKLRFEDYGRNPVGEQAPAPGRKRNRLGFFGQLSFYKGVDLLLEAIKRLSEEGSDVHLSIHGANLDYQPEGFQQRFRALLEETKSNVTLVGAYEPHELRGHMTDVDWVVVPSRWWENSPLVIQEAFMHGRPVICSDIGGMAEKVADGVNGLYFRAGNAASLRETISRAIGTSGLWERLRSRIPEVYPMESHVKALTTLYEGLLGQKSKEGTLATRAVREHAPAP